MVTAREPGTLLPRRFLILAPLTRDKEAAHKRFCFKRCVNDFSCRRSHGKALSVARAEESDDIFNLTPVQVRQSGGFKFITGVSL